MNWEFCFSGVRKAAKRLTTQNRELFSSNKSYSLQGYKDIVVFKMACICYMDERDNDSEKSALKTKAVDKCEKYLELACPSE